MKLMAIHEIEYLDPKTKKRAIAEPNHPFDIADDEGERLKKLNAARDLTEAEEALEQMRGGGRKAPAKKAPAKKTPAKKTKAEAENASGGGDGGEGGDGDDLV